MATVSSERKDVVPIRSAPDEAEIPNIPVDTSDGGACVGVEEFSDRIVSDVGIAGSEGVDG